MSKWDWLNIVFKYSGTATKAIVVYKGITGIGISKLLPGDKFSKEIGEQIALGRAFIDVGIRYQNKWIQRSVTEEQVTQQREQKKVTAGSLRTRVNRVRPRALVPSIPRPQYDK